MDVYTRWHENVAKTVNRFAHGATREQREDFMQDCFVGLIESQQAIDDVESRDGAKGAEQYVVQICRHKIVNGLRVVGKHGGVDISELGAEQSDKDPLLSKEDFGVSEVELDEAVQKLDRREQYIIRCIYFQGLSEKDVGKTLSRSQQWVNVEKHKAILLLRAILDKEEL